jgi:MFS family permease
MAADIGGASKALWLPQTATIVAVAFSTPISQVADYWGRKGPLLLACLAVCIGSIIVSRAAVMDMALAGNTIASFSIAAMPLLFTVTSEIVPRRYRPPALGGINAMLSITGIVVLLAGTTLCQNYVEGWRILWYVCAASGALATLLIFFLYHPPPRDLQISLTVKEKLARLDWVGICLIPAATILIIVALTWSQNPYLWDDAHILAPFITGTVMLGFVIVYEAKIKQDGLFHRQLFTQGYNFAIALFAIFVEGATFFTANSFFPMEIAILFGTDAFDTGLRFSVAFFAATAAAMVVSWYSSWRRVVRWPLVAGFICFVVAFGTSLPLHVTVLLLRRMDQADHPAAGMISVDASSTVTTWISALFLGLGLGTVLTPLTTAAQFSAPPQLIAMSTGALLCLRTFGGILLPVNNAIFNSGLTKYIPANIAERVLPLGLPREQLGRFIAALSGHNQTAVEAIPGVTPSMVSAGLEGLQLAYVSSFRMLWILPLVLSVLAVIGKVPLFIRDCLINQFN